MRIRLFSSNQTFHRVIALVVVVLVCSSSFVNTVKSSLGQNTFRKYYSMPSARLHELGTNWLHDEATLDSALLVLTILSERETSKREDIHLKAKSLNDLGFLYSYYYYDYKEAYSALDKADELCNEYGFKQLMPLVELNLANLIYNNDRLYEPFEIDESLGLYKKAFSHSIESENFGFTLMILENLLCIVFYHDCIDSVSDIIDKFQQIEIPDSVQLKQFTINHLDGIIAYSSGNIERAIADARAMRMGIDSKESQNRHLINSYFFECRCEAKRGNLEAALSICNEALALAQLHSEKDAIMLLQREQENIYRQKGNIKEADLRHCQYLIYKDSIINDYQMGKVKKMKFKNELSKVNEMVKELEVKDRIRQKTIVWMVVVIVLLVLLIASLAYSRKLLQNKNAHLYKSYQEILKREEEQEQLLKSQLCDRNDNIVRLRTDDPQSGVLADRKYKDSVLDDTLKKELWEQVLHVMATSPEIYSQNFSASRLAELAGGIQLVHLSQLIGEMTGSNFYNLLCKYRIREACRIMNSDKAYTWSVEGISLQTGFKSRSNFSTNFKRIVGMTPAQYMQEARKTHILNDDTAE